MDVALDTSRRSLSLAVAFGAEVLADEGSERAQASDLLVRLEVLLARAGAPRDARGRLVLRTILVGLGPGSYTGLRVGLATAQGLAHATGATLFGLPSFEALAYRELEPGQEGTVAMDARAGRFYHARYRREAETLETREAPAALSAAELCARCLAPGPILAHAGLAEAAGLPSAAAGRVRTTVGPSALGLLALARAREEAGLAPGTRTPAPLYLAEFGARASGPG